MVGTLNLGLALEVRDRQLPVKQNVVASQRKLCCVCFAACYYVVLSVSKVIRSLCSFPAIVDANLAAPELTLNSTPSRRSCVLPGSLCLYMAMCKRSALET